MLFNSSHTNGIFPETWKKAHLVPLKTGKTKAIIFGSEYNINLLQRFNLPGIEVQDNIFVPFIEEVTNLGVVMDSKLTWKPQLAVVSRKVNRALYGLRSFSPCTTEALRKRLVGALVICHLDYCCAVYLDVTDELQNRLQKLQNGCVRYVCGVRKREHITPYRKKLDWLDIERKRSYFVIVQMYKACCMRQPPYLAELFEKNQSRTSGRAPRELLIPRS